MARTRSRTGYGQLLLLAALLFGIVTMHTLGHPSGGHEGAGTSAPAAAAAPVPASGTASSPMRHGMGGMAAPDAVGGEHGSGSDGRGSDGRGAHRAHQAAPAPERHDGMSMDPLSVCLAVLGAFTLVLLVRAGLLRPGGILARLPATGRLTHGPRPDPPPARIRLARLSVLRI
ncbi:hypothetical protein [Streptomyces sp. NPDC087300]|uniref:hypothetical protein n=1 Tax=Streptomyces sp. NPDC087300 TaxID=3365780 RepID=UPI00380CCCE0